MPAKTAIFASLAALCLVPAAVNAAPIAPATTAAPASPAATSRADNPNQRYCIETEQTGSRIRRLQCDKLSGWQSQGIDPRLMPRRK